MIRIEIKWFAAYREATGLEQETVQTDAASASELFREMAGQHENLLDFKGALVAINDEMADWNAALSDGDEILFFPPVAGG
jgi:molybdopterin converting factor small subunit